eukprot:SAG31_NODE_9058_length_1341_cov_7.323671_1_plen_233_part_10
MELETSAPEVVAQMVEQISSSYTIDATGTRAFRARNGELYWDVARSRPAGLTRVHGAIRDAFSTVASKCTLTADLAYFASQPWCQELPAALLAALAADPTTDFARRFRSYAKHDLVPDLLRVTNLLEQHAAVVDLPPLEFLKTKFPQDNWHIQPTNQYQLYWVARTRQWQALLTEWDAGHIEVMYPPNALYPHSGLHGTIEWAITSGQERQNLLIGCTTTNAFRTAQVFVKRC